ncbi:MAG: hypothetical protein KAH95_08280, partial [Spirochaetales bacterium]|nr:hypothetical protein [Spirochaetales bacterium]
MIVPMKKVFILLLNSDKNDALKRLKDIGVIHLEDINGSGDKLSLLQSEKDMVSRSLAIIPDVKKKKAKEITYGKEETLEITKRIISLNDDQKSLSDSILNINKEIDRIKIWGDFNPEDINLLRNSGVNLKLFELKKTNLKELSENIAIFTIATVKSLGYYVIISDSFDEMEKFEEVNIPELGLEDLYSKLETIKRSKEKVIKELETLSDAKSSLEKLLTDYN